LSVLVEESKHVPTLAHIDALFLQLTAAMSGWRKTKRRRRRRRRGKRAIFITVAYKKLALYLLIAIPGIVVY
jgi:hypothetical protein